MSDLPLSAFPSPVSMPPAPDFRARLADLLAFNDATDSAVQNAVSEILAGVRASGDAAVLEYTARFDRLNAPDMAALELSQADLQAALDKLPLRLEQALAPGRRAGAGVSREAAPGILDLHRGGRHGAGPAGHRAGSRRPVCAGRQGGLSVFGVDERDSRQGGRRQGTDHGGADAGWRAQRSGAGGGGGGRRRSRVHHRRRAGGGGAGLRHRDHPAGGQDRRPRQRLCRGSQAPRVRHRRHRHDRRPVGNPGDLRRQDRSRTGSRWTCSRRPSTTNWRNPS